MPYANGPEWYEKNLRQEDPMTQSPHPLSPTCTGSIKLQADGSHHCEKCGFTVGGRTTTSSGVRTPQLSEVYAALRAAGLQLVRTERGLSIEKSISGAQAEVALTKNSEATP